MQNKIFLFALVLLVIFGGIIWYLNYNVSSVPVIPATPDQIVKVLLPELKVGDSSFRISIARTDEEKTRGLGGVRELSEDMGMYFVFEEPVAQSFWNKGMVVPFDLIWIKDSKVIGIVSDIPPENKGAQTVYPPSEIDAVLELKAGTASKRNIKMGDKVFLST